jgi:hypothetical protein
MGRGSSEHGLGQTAATNGCSLWPNLFHGGAWSKRPNLKNPSRLPLPLQSGLACVPSEVRRARSAGRTNPVEGQPTPWAATSSLGWTKTDSARRCLAGVRASSTRCVCGLADCATLTWRGGCSIKPGSPPTGRARRARSRCDPPGFHSPTAGAHSLNRIRGRGARPAAWRRPWGSLTATLPPKKLSRGDMSSEAVDNDTPSEAPDSHEIEVEVESRMTPITSKRTGHPSRATRPRLMSHPSTPAPSQAASSPTTIRSGALLR